MKKPRTLSPEHRAKISATRRRTEVGKRAYEYDGHNLAPEAPAPQNYADNLRARAMAAKARADVVSAWAAQRQSAPWPPPVDKMAELAQQHAKERAELAALRSNVDAGDPWDRPPTTPLTRMVAWKPSEETVANIKFHDEAAHLEAAAAKYRAEMRDLEISFEKAAHALHIAFIATNRTILDAADVTKNK